MRNQEDVPFFNNAVRITRCSLFVSLLRRDPERVFDEIIARVQSFVDKIFYLSILLCIDILILFYLFFFKYRLKFLFPIVIL